MSGILAVPIHGAEDEILELPKDDLPDDPNEIMQILANELAPLKLWLELAVSYYQQQRMEQFQTVMETSTGEDGPFYQDYYQGDKEGRIALLNCLAAYHTQVSVRTKNKSKKEQHLQAANVHYQNSDKIDSNMPLTWCGKALIHMARISIPDKWSRGARDKEMQHLRDAGFMFDQALECDKAFIPALLGKAAVLFNRRHYTNALECYKTVVKLNPACPPEVRLGIAHCYSGLKQYKRAREAFQRVLDLAPDNTEALAGMAVIEMNTTPSDSLTKEEQEQLRAQSVSSGLKLMERAYNSSLQGKRSSVVLNHLANHFIVRGDYQKAHLLAVEAFQNTEVKQIRAEACFHIARTFHMRGKMDEAHRYYTYSSESWPEFNLPLFGLGQTHMHARRWTEAIACLDKVLKAHPNSYEVRKMLGIVCARSGDTVKAMEHLKKILEREEATNIDEDVWNQLAVLHEVHQPAMALKYHLNARVALKQRGKKVTPQLLGNIAALFHKLGKLDDAMTFYKKAIRGFGLEAPGGDGNIVRTDGADQALQGNAVTVLYNMARLHEQANQLEQAHTLYRAILKERPNYLDAFMRLGAMAEIRGNTREASDWYVEGLNVQPAHADAWTALSKLHFKASDFAQSQAKLEKILTKNPHDAMANIMLGNIYFVCAKFEPGAPDEEKAKSKYTQHLSRALDFYRKVLDKERNNAYAANGIGAVLAQTGRLDEAKKVFAQLREAAVGQVPDVWVNLAHIHMVQGEYAPAIKLYRSALDRFFGGHDVLLLTCIAKAQLELSFQSGRLARRAGREKGANMDRGMAKQCRRTLQKAMHLAPRDRSLQFNLALLLKLSADSVIKGVREAHSEWVSKEDAVEAPPYSKADLESVKSDIMVMRRLANLLSKITDEREFPKDKKKDAAAIDAWGLEAAKVIPIYTDAVEEMRIEFDKKRDDIRKEEQAKVVKREEEAAAERARADEERRLRQLRAVAIENKRKELINDDGFLKARPKTARVKTFDDDMVDMDAGRSRLEKNKYPALFGRSTKEGEEILQGLKIFLLPSDDEGEDMDDSDKAAKGFLDSDEEGGDGDAYNGTGSIEEDDEGVQVLKRAGKRQRTAGDEEEAADGSEQAGEGEAGEAGASQGEDEAQGESKIKKRKVEDDED